MDDIVSVVVAGWSMEQPTYRFPEPKRKTRHKWQNPLGYQSPFPVPIASVVGLSVSSSRWNYFTGRLVGSSVYIDDTASAHSLYHMVHQLLVL